MFNEFFYLIATIIQQEMIYTWDVSVREDPSKPLNTLKFQHLSMI